jgi:hypothetical protein
MKRFRASPDDQSLSRRRFITSAGVTITLPMLPSLLYSRRAGAAACAPIKRFLAYHFANGHHMPEHLPTAAGSGAAWALPPMLTAMQDLKADLTYVSGLENQMRRRETGDHAIGCGALLTARKPTANQQLTSMSVDQAIADGMKGCARIDSLQLGTHNSGPTDSFGTYYTRSISWRAPSTMNADGTVSYPAGAATPLGKEIDVKKAFDRLFAGTDTGTSTVEADKRRALRQSVLDAVVPHGDWLRNKLNTADRSKVDELFTGIRALEQEIMVKPPTGAACTPPAAPGTGLDFTKQLDYMHSLMAIAFQCDITRVITFMMSDALSNRNLSFIPEVAALPGTDAGDHSVSHHTGSAELVARFRAMVLWKMNQIAGFLRKLKMTTDADGQPMLNNMLVWISSEIADGNRHNHDDKPILLAGRLGGLVTPDRHIRFPTNRDYTKVKTYGDFFITLLSLYDVTTTAFGDDGKEAIVWQR